MPDTAYNLYYEMAEGGGNLPYHTLADALEGFELMVTQNPDCYACLTGWDYDGKIREYVGARYVFE